VFYNLSRFIEALQEDKENAATDVWNLTPGFSVDFSLHSR